MAKSAFSSMSIVIGCACAGFVVGMVSLTGIGVIFGDMMIQAAHGLLFPSLLFTAITCVILGMGLPTTAAYVIAASILAPSLIKLGLPALTAHLFVILFWPACRHYTSCSPGSLCWRWYRKDKPHDNGNRACQTGLCRIHGAIRLLL